MAVQTGTTRRSRRVRSSGWLIMLAATVLLTSPLLPGAVAPGASASTPPDVVLVVADDQRWDMVTATSMPTVYAELVDKGVTFSNAYVVNPLCCPSRTTILTGQHSHTTLVYDNGGPYGGFQAFKGDTSTVATWLQAVGYRTGLIGKYLNGYGVPYVPPGWDRWVAFLGADAGGAYYNYDLFMDDGSVVRHGSTDADYSTDVLAGYATEFIRTTPAGQPLFLMLTPYAPHMPTTPAPRHSTAFSNLKPLRPPNYNEEDVSDKPAWVRALPLIPLEKQRQIDRNRKNQFQTMLAVDEAIGEVLTTLSETGRLSNTLVIYTSDHGWSLGEHRWNNKKVAFEEASRVPLVIRYDPLVSRPRTDPHLAANVDLAPTIASAAGVSSPGAEGLDLIRLLTDPRSSWRHQLLIEHLQNSNGRDPVPSFCAVRDDSLQ